jgi:hypothetical protein
MRNPLPVVMCAAALAIIAAPIRSAASDRMAPLAFYVGTWTCADGPIGRPTHQGTRTFAMRGGVMFESIVIPRQGDLPRPSVTNATFAFDEKNIATLKPRWTILRPGTSRLQNRTGITSSAGGTSPLGRNFPAGT